MALVLLAMIVLVAGTLSIRPVDGSGRSDPPPSTEPATPPSTPPVVAVPDQPDSQGFEYTVRRERYVVRQHATAPLEVQFRLRESWRAADGWAWARQTGDEPAQFIFAPDTDWAVLRDPPADPRVLERSLTPATDATAAERDAALFDFVVDVLGVETLPAGALPAASRRRIVTMLGRISSVTVTRHQTDPEGRTATRLRFINRSVSSGMIETLYLGEDYEFLAAEFTVNGTGEHGSNVITQRRTVAQIPPDLLSILGTERAEKGVQPSCPNQQASC